MLRVGVMAGLLLVSGCASQPQESLFISGSCPSEVDTAVVDVVTAQQQAFAEGDFTTARSFASAEFQSAVDLDQFTEIIESQYSYLLKDPALEFTECDLRRGKAYLTVIVQASPAQTLTYRLVPEANTWRIDEAVAAVSPAVSA